MKFTIKTSLEHLPEQKRSELEKIVSLIKKHAKVEMIILFGSYARGTWVEDRYVDPSDGTTYEYQSDYDLLLVCRSKIGANKIGLWNKIESLIARDTDIKTLVSLIVHDIRELNEKLSTGEYFFTDIVKEGILLYDSGKFSLVEPQQPNPQQRITIAKQDYDYWFESASDFLDIFKFCMSHSKFNKAAFLLNQSIEHFFVCTLLVLTHYKPKLHNLQKLFKAVSELDYHFTSVFPLRSEAEKKAFTLINNAYISARYSKTYSISEEDLHYMYTRVNKLKVLTEEICLNHIRQIASME